MDLFSALLVTAFVAQAQACRLLPRSAPWLLVDSVTEAIKWSIVVNRGVLAPVDLLLCASSPELSTAPPVALIPQA